MFETQSKTINLQKLTAKFQENRTPLILWEKYWLFIGYTLAPQKKKRYTFITVIQWIRPFATCTNVKCRIILSCCVLVIVCILYVGLFMFVHSKNAGVKNELTQSLLYKFNYAGLFQPKVLGCFNQLLSQTWTFSGSIQPSCWVCPLLK